MAEQQIASFIRQTLLNLIRELENSSGGTNNLDSVLYRLDWLYNSLVRYLGVLDCVNEEVINIIRDANDILQMIDAQNTPHSYRVEQLSNGQRGRPRFNVPKEQLEFLIERGFSIPDIAHILGISVRTTERRLLEFGLFATQAFTSIDNQSLDHTIQDIVRYFPSFGYRRMTGALLSRGIRVSQVRIREAMRRVNPEGVLLRALTINTVNRRKYQVHSPLSLWHIDGNHKLIRLVIKCIQCN